MKATALQKARCVKKESPTIILVCLCEAPSSIYYCVDTWTLAITRLGPEASDWVPRLAWSALINTKPGNTLATDCHSNTAMLGADNNYHPANRKNQDNINIPSEDVFLFNLGDSVHGSARNSQSSSSPCQNQEVR